MHMLKKRFGERIQQLRRQKGISQEKLEESSGLHATHISEIEQGRGNPSLNTINRLARGLKVPLWEIFMGMEIKKAWPTIEQIRSKGFYRTGKRGRKGYKPRGKPPEASGKTRRKP